MRERYPTVYIVTNRRDGVLYTGVTSQPVQRISQHKVGEISGFTKRYNCTKLVYFEHYETMDQAIGREKQIKGYVRRKKIALIEACNPEWRDLYDDIVA